MGRRISFKDWHLTGKTAMKKAVMAMIMGVMLLLSSCGQAENSEEAQTNVTGDTAETGYTLETGYNAETGGSISEFQETRNDNIAGSSDSDLAELENLTGEYEYLSDLGTGRLIILKTSNGYDICDYESESLYRFLAGSFDIETIENNRIYLKYPEQVLDDDTVVFSYYVLEYSTDEIDVYCGESGFEDTLFLYHATKKKEEGTEFAANRQESDMQEVEDTGIEGAADELLDSFINGSTSAVDSADLTSAYYITDLNTDPEGWDAYSVGEKVDLDNDGENELIISGPYGGIYLDARDNKVYELAAGEGNALILSYVYYNGAIWIMYSNRMNAGYESYHMEKYEGADNLVAEMNFGEEPVDPNNSEFGMKYTWNGTEISYDEYTALCSKILATEVNTN